MLAQVDQVQTITTATLRDWLEVGRALSIVDIRPMAERAEWYIPSSIHIEMYDKLKQGDINVFHGLHLEKTIPVVFYCYSGQSSKKAAKLFAQQGYDTYSLEGGLKSWSMSWNTAEIVGDDYKIIQCRRTGKGCLSYIIISGDEAAVVDASLDVAVYEQILFDEGCTLKYVIETHTHADHLSRSLALSLKMQAPLLLPESNAIEIKYTPLSNAMPLQVGKTALTTIATPGHTACGVSFLVGSEVLLTGDTLFTHGVGRPDLNANQDQALSKCKLLYQSVHHLLTYPDVTIVLPAHTNRPIDFDHMPIQSTIGELKKLPLLQLDELNFSENVLTRTRPVPSNFKLILSHNQQGLPIPTDSLDLESGANRCGTH